MKVRAVFVAGKVILSRTDNAVTAVELTELLTVYGVPEELPVDARLGSQLTFLAMFDAVDESEAPSGLVPAAFWIETPKGRRDEKDIALDFMGTRRSRVMLQLFSIPFDGAGEYSFVIDGPAGRASWEIEIVTFHDPEPSGTDVLLATPLPKG